MGIEATAFAQFHFALLALLYVQDGNIESAATAKCV